MQNNTIDEIANILAQPAIDKKVIRKLKKDPRKGIMKLIEKWEKGQEILEMQRNKLVEMTTYERELYASGYDLIAGIDEVGRGPLAGPVVAAAVILPQNFDVLGVNDSKQVSEEKRENLFELIQEHAVGIGIGIIPSHQIDEVNIYQATKLAMKKAILQLSIRPDYLLVDAMKIDLEIPQLSITKGDEKSVSIAASSIVAKVIRDRYMKRLGEEYPVYGFQNHMGYGTKQHLEAIHTHGITSEHRLTFSPIKDGLPSS
jgi:ribonuclease HII